MMISKTATVPQAPITRPAFRESFSIARKARHPRPRSSAGTAAFRAERSENCACFLVQIDGIYLRSEPVTVSRNRREAGVGYQIVSGWSVISVPWFLDS